MKYLLVALLLVAGCAAPESQTLPGRLTEFRVRETARVKATLDGRPCVLTIPPGGIIWTISKENEFENVW